MVASEKIIQNKKIIFTLLIMGIMCVDAAESVGQQYDIVTVDGKEYNIRGVLRPCKSADNRIIARQKKEIEELNRQIRATQALLNGKTNEEIQQAEQELAQQKQEKQRAKIARLMAGDVQESDYRGALVPKKTIVNQQRAQIEALQTIFSKLIEQKKTALEGLLQTGLRNVLAIQAVIGSASENQQTDEENIEQLPKDAHLEIQEPEREEDTNVVTNAGAIDLASPCHELDIDIISRQVDEGIEEANREKEQEAAYWQQEVAAAETAITMVAMNAVRTRYEEHVARQTATSSAVASTLPEGASGGSTSSSGNLTETKALSQALAALEAGLNSASAAESVQASAATGGVATRYAPTIVDRRRGARRASGRSHNAGTITPV